MEQRATSIDEDQLSNARNSRPPRPGSVFYQEITATDARTGAIRTRSRPASDFRFPTLNGHPIDGCAGASLLMLRQPFAGHALGFGDLVGGHIAGHGLLATLSALT
jgi:hypothetical protein